VVPLPKDCVGGVFFKHPRAAEKDAVSTQENRSFFTRLLPVSGEPYASLRLFAPPGCDIINSMKTPTPVKPSISGRIPIVLLWLFGVPLPIIIIILLFRGCT
jgi:hypothetical protein